MATVAERRQAAVIGALVADAAVQPLHWIYNDEKLDGLIKDKEEIEFWTPSANPFYNIETGLHSCYGDQAFVILKSLVDSKGVDVKHLTKETYNSFGPQSPYDDDTNKNYTGTKEEKVTTAKMPIPRPWRHASIKHFLKNVDAGSTNPGSETDEQIDCVLRMIPVAAMFAGRPEMLEKVEDVLRVTQNFDTSVTIGLAAARILEQYILHGKKTGVVEEVIKQLEDQKRNNPQELDRAMVGFLKEVLPVVDNAHRDVVKNTFRKD